LLHLDELPPPLREPRPELEKKTRLRRKIELESHRKKHSGVGQKHAGAEGWRLLVAPPPPILT
jgi:hypothetical protein